MLFSVDKTFVYTRKFLLLKPSLMAPKGSRPESQAPSREPSQDSRLPQRQPSRGRSLTRRSPSIASTISDNGSEEPHRRKRRNKKRYGGLPAVDEVEDTGKEIANTAKGVVNTVGDTAGAVVGGGGGGDKPLKLRLDLNLDADTRLTAKVHGDITLSLL